MRPSAWLLTGLLGVALTNCTGGAAPSGDAGADARPRPDRLNLNCTSPAGNENAADCNARFGAMVQGASFFIGGGAECRPDPNTPACQPLCALTDMNADNCTFAAPATGCPFIASEGFAVVVEVGGRRALAGTRAGDACPSVPGERRAWGRVDTDTLASAAACARVTPAGGWGAERYGGCTSVGAACGPAGASPADMCQQLQFMAGPVSYMANVCTHACSGDADCGPRGVCEGGECFARCGGPCALSCEAGFSCSDGTCLPNPP